MHPSMGLIAGAVLFSLSVQAAAAAEAAESVTTSAAPAKVWQIIGKFDAIAAWLPGAESSPADKGDEVGSVRVITLKAPGSPTVTERLTAHTGQSYSYAILKVDPKVLPVSDYTSTIEVTPSGSGSVVSWRGRFQPAGGADDAAASKAMSGVYRAGLDNIKALAEK